MNGDKNVQLITFRENVDDLQLIVKKLNKFAETCNDGDIKKWVELSVNAARVIWSFPENFDEHSSITRCTIGKNSFLDIANKKSLNSYDVWLFFMFLARVIKEIYLRHERLNEIKIQEFAAILDHFNPAKRELVGEEREGFIFLNDRMPILVMQFLLNKEIDSKFKDKSNVLSKDLEKIQGKIQRTDHEIGELKKEKNFVNLSSAFGGMLRLKKKEYWWSLSILVVMGFLLLIPFSGILIYDFIKGFSLLGMLKYIPVIGLNLILLYYFQIALHHFDLVKTQILELKYRNAATGFVESYADFAIEKRSKEMADLLKKYEGLVFSELTKNYKNPSAHTLEKIISSILAKNLKS